MPINEARINTFVELITNLHERANLPQALRRKTPAQSGKAIDLWMWGCSSNFKRLVPNTQIRSIKAEITMTMTFVHLGRGFVTNYKQYLSLKCGSSKIREAAKVLNQVTNKWRFSRGRCRRGQVSRQRTNGFLPSLSRDNGLPRLRGTTPWDGRKISALSDADLCATKYCGILRCWEVG